MDFNPSKPTHILSLVILSIALCVIFILPIFSFYLTPLAVDSNQINELSSVSKLIFEIVTLILQIFVVAIGVFIIVPFTWYFLINKFSLKEILDKIKLRKEGIDLAIIWGLIFTFIMFIFIFIINISLHILGFNLEEISNISDLEQIFSIPSIFFIVCFQPIGEEIFFRGFLFDKINSVANQYIAIVLTSILFGIAHITYGNVFPAIITAVLGILLAYMVVKTKNLTTSIVAHILFNAISVILYITGQNFMT